MVEESTAASHNLATASATLLENVGRFGGVSTEERPELFTGASKQDFPTQKRTVRQLIATAQQAHIEEENDWKEF
jgi:hypothetical protein